MDEKQIIEAIREACREAGGQVAFARLRGISQSWISDFVTGRRNVKNMTLATLLKFFPDVEITLKRLPAARTENEDTGAAIRDLQKRMAALEEKEKKDEKSNYHNRNRKTELEAVKR